MSGIPIAYPINYLILDQSEQISETNIRNKHQQ